MHDFTHITEIMITLQNITLRRGQKLLLEDVNLTLFAKQKIGLIGENGCGKTSFFALLQGMLDAHQGDVTFPNHLEIAHVSQEIPTSDRPAIDYVIDGDHRYRALEERLRIAEDRGDGNLLAQCHDEMANMDGYAIEGRAEKILKGLGFQSDELTRPTIHFSGGWRMRLNLAQALMSRSDLLLLDEPTNHLDLDAIIWLEKWLQEFTGTLLVISHDREFLDNTVTHIINFRDRQLYLYKGNYSSFETQLFQEKNLQQAAYEKQQVQVAHLQSFIDRFKAKASKARQAQSRVKALEKMQLVAAVEVRSTFKFTFKSAKDCPNPLLRMEKVSIGYDSQHPVLNNVNVQLAPADRIGLLGVNGAGKSTFIKALAGKLQPLAGDLQLYKGIKIGYFAQHQIEHLDMELSPLDMMQNIAPHTNSQALRNFLGTFNFSGTMATDKISHFSGGEKARLALALIVWQEPNILLLDEPTNHLDMNMREALSLALQEYNGALILVSHDRHLIRTTTDELMLVADNTVTHFTGDLDDYRELTLQKKNDFVSNQKKVPNRNLGKEKRKLQTQLTSLEKELAQLQDKKLQLDHLLAEQAASKQPDLELIKKHTDESKQISTKLQKLEEEWLRLYENLNE